jgi:hypothetical protein
MLRSYRLVGSDKKQVPLACSPLESAGFESCWRSKPRGHAPILTIAVIAAACTKTMTRDGQTRTS